MSWVTRLEEYRHRALRAEEAEKARNSDPWRLPLGRRRGKLGDDGIQRRRTPAAFDVLEVPQRKRGGGGWRRLAKLMRELGWTPIKARGLNQAGFRDMIRGYAREQRRSSLS